jgi:hypothetical protein
VLAKNRGICKSAVMLVLLCASVASWEVINVSKLSELTRSKVYLNRGDWVEVKFPYPNGFLVVSEPGSYFINAGYKASSTSAKAETWYHTLSPGIQQIGNHVGFLQVVALTAASFEITSGYYGSLDSCQSIGLVRSDHTLQSDWPLPGLQCWIAGNQFGYITGTNIQLHNLAIDLYAQSHLIHTLNDTHSTHTIERELGVGAVRLLPLKTEAGRTLQTELQFTVPANESLLFLTPNTTSAAPTNWNGDVGSDYWKGGCDSVKCPEADTTTSGLATSEDIDSSTWIVIIIVFACLLFLAACVIGLFCWFWRQKESEGWTDADKA